ncbi:MAG: Cell division integral membrane protein, YggT and half-length relatives, partial [uncultured Solirubrobacterales bacterium]
ERPARRGRDRPRRRGGLRRHPVHGLRGPDHRPDRPLVDSADALQPGAARGRRLRGGRDESIPQLLPPLHSAHSHRAGGARPEPDHRDLPADHPPGHRRRPDPGL